MTRQMIAAKSALRIVRVLMGALFLFAAFMKLTGQPMMVAEFEHFGFGQWFRYLTGSLELIGGIGVLIPRFSLFAAVLLLLVDAGAFVAQVASLHGDWTHTIVIGVMLGALVYFQRETFGGFPGARLRYQENSDRAREQQ